MTFPCGALLALCIACSAAHAQTVPNSGELLQQTPRPAAPAPSSDTGLTIQQAPPDQPSSSASFLVQHIDITGNTLLSTTELHSLVAPGEGKVLNLSYLEGFAALITRRYQERGYLLSRAYIPAQTLSAGVVRIAVLEAHYGQIDLANTSHVSDSTLRSFLAPLKPGAPVTEDALEHSLLLLSDVPGAVVNSTLTAGAEFGSSNLEVSAGPGALYSGSVVLDDSGNRYTGRVRGSGTLNLNDPFGYGDMASVTALTAGENLSYGRLGYQALVSGSGMTLGASASGLYYHLGSGLSDLQAHGTAEVESLTLMQPLIRSTISNLYAQFAFDAKQLGDEIDTTDIHTDRHTNAFTMTLAGDRRDASGITNANLGLSVGHLGFVNEAAEIADSTAARIRGTYAILDLSVARLQSITAADSIYLALNGQLANKNLDTSVQFFLGGPNSVRAYDVGNIGGAQGALATAELRHTLSLAVPGAWMAIAFVDSGWVQVYKNTFDAGDNHATLSGAGVGLNWVGPRGWNASCAIATPFGGAPSLGGERDSVRVWAEVHKAFNFGSR